MRHPTISEELYFDLLNSILRAEFPVDGRLPTETTLAQRYGVSRSTVRNALARLREDGHITSRQGSGSVVVARPRDIIEPFAPVESLADLERCFECRISLEGEIAYFVAQRRNETDLRAFDEHIERMGHIVTAKEFHTAEDTEFHMALAKASRNQFFESIMISIRPHILFGMNISKTLSQSYYRRHATLSWEEHKVVVDAVRDRNPEAARQAMRAHLDHSRRRIFEGA